MCYLYISQTNKSNHMNERHDIQDDIIFNAGVYCFDDENDKKFFKTWLKENAGSYGMSDNYLDKALNIVENNNSWCTDNEDDVAAMVAAFNTPRISSEELKLRLANMESLLTVHMAYVRDDQKAVFQKAINGLYFLSEEL